VTGRAREPVDTAPLRVGVLGAARISALSVIGPAATTGDRLVAVAARDRSRAEAFAARHGIERVVDSYAALVADPEVEVVYNPLANALHAPWNLAAVRAGKHVLTEKPSASNAEEAREVRDAVAAAGVRLMEGFHYPYHPLHARLHELVRSGELGDLRTVEIHMVMPRPDDDDPRWRLDLSGGGLMDVGCYGLHALRLLGRLLGGAPRVVGARAGERDPGVDAWLDAELELPGGVPATMRCGMTAPAFDFSYRLVGTRGQAFAPDFPRPHESDVIEVTTPDGTRVEELGRRSSYTYQLEALAAHLRDGAPLITDADDAVATMELIDDTYRAAGLDPRPRREPAGRVTDGG
jgi:predicted dehydrogenase